MLALGKVKFLTVFVSWLQAPGWLDAGAVLSLVMAQLSLAIAILCLSGEGGGVKSSVSLGRCCADLCSTADPLAAAEAFLLSADEGSGQSICTCIWPAPSC